MKKKCEHEYGPYKNTPYKDIYTRTCKLCGHTEETEKDFR